MVECKKTWCYKLVEVIVEVSMLLFVVLHAWPIILILKICLIPNGYAGLYNLSNLELPLIDQDRADRIHSGASRFGSWTLKGENL